MVTRTKKIFVGGLSTTTTLDEVKAYFAKFGEVWISFNACTLVLEGSKSLVTDFHKNFRLKMQCWCMTNKQTVTEVLVLWHSHQKTLWRESVRSTFMKSTTKWWAFKSFERSSKDLFLVRLNARKLNPRRWCCQSILPRENVSPGLLEISLSWLLSNLLSPLSDTLHILCQWQLQQQLPPLNSWHSWPQLLAASTMSWVQQFPCQSQWCQHFHWRCNQACYPWFLKLIKLRELLNSKTFQILDIMSTIWSISRTCKDQTLFLRFPFP